MAELVSGFVTEYSYDIPETGQETIILPFAKADFVTQPDFSLGCTQTYSYVLDDPFASDDTSPDLVMGANSGYLFLRNDADIKTDYEFTLHILTTDGTNDVELEIPGMKVSTVCGLSSTTITAPSLIPQYQVPGLTQVVSIEGEFISSNPTCPIVSHSLLQGSDDFDLTDNGADFVVEMQTDDNEVIDGYIYEVEATADGGLTASIQGTADINVVCVADLVTSF